MDLREVGYDDRDWINLAQDRDRRRGYLWELLLIWLAGNRFPERQGECLPIDKYLPHPIQQFWGGRCRAQGLVDAWNLLHLLYLSKHCLATGVVQSVRALACRSEVALGRGFDSRLGWLPGWVFSEVFLNRKVNARRTAGYTLLDRKRDEEILEQLEVESVEEKITRYKFNWLDHVRRMENSRIPKIMMQYKPRGHRRPGRSFRRLLDGSETGLQRPNS
ncbi:hypothetical protein ANN_18106 [Periplaneta americana]|uniref:Uncharacterized protein n=1 Tax=Periplaneta americana TaxID=6978 RepID=A0ABQ8SMV0_PERAM|nr:hypothetical protein ANN_18106 [Periplaneta americana]